MNRYTFVYAFIVLVVVALGAGAYFVYTMPKDLPSATTQLPSTMIDASRAGDYDTVLSEYATIAASPDKSADEKALALYNKLGAEYRVSSDPAARLNDIREMKKVILDENVSLSIRVNLLNVLAGQYSISGADPAVFEEIFKDAPFNQYLTQAGNQDLTARLSTRKLFEWSYSLMPTSFAAINIARWYSEQRAFNPQLDQATAREYSRQAEDYLLKADAASVEEAKRDTEFFNSTRYLTFRYWRTVIVGRLSLGAGELGGKYKPTYRQTFEDFFTFAQQQKNALAFEYILYARQYLANFLVRNGEREAGIEQLNLLAAGMNKLNGSETSVFLQFLRNEYEYRPTGATWTNLVANQIPLSPAFEAAVEKVVGADL